MEPDAAEQVAEKASATQEFDTEDDRELWRDGFTMGYATGVTASPDEPVLHSSGILDLPARLRKNSKVFGDMFKDSSLLLDAAAEIKRLRAAEAASPSEELQHMTAMARYARHLPTCASNRITPPYPGGPLALGGWQCGCGFDAALRTTKEGEDEHS